MKRKFEGNQIINCKRIKENKSCESCDVEEEEFYTIDSFIREYIFKLRKKKQLKNKKKSSC